MRTGAHLASWALKAAGFSCSTTTAGSWFQSLQNVMTIISLISHNHVECRICRSRLRNSGGNGQNAVSLRRLTLESFNDAVIQRHVLDCLLFYSLYVCTQLRYVSSVMKMYDDDDDDDGMENEWPRNWTGKKTGPGEKPSRHDGFSPCPVVFLAIWFVILSSPAFIFTWFLVSRSFKHPVCVLASTINYDNKALNIKMSIVTCYTVYVIIKIHNIENYTNSPV